MYNTETPPHNTVIEREYYKIYKSFSSATASTRVFMFSCEQLPDKSTNYNIRLTYCLLLYSHFMEL